MNRLTTLILTVMICTVFFYSETLHAAVAGGTDTTPTVYEVTVTKVEFQRADGTFFDLNTGNILLDIASSLAGQSVGAVAEGVILPAGAYTGMRLTFSRTFGITALIADAGMGTRGFTTTGNGTTTAGAITNIGVATAGAGAATKQSVDVPDGGDADTAIANAGLTEVGTTELQMTTPFAFVIEEGDVMPAIQIDFDVTDAVEFAEPAMGTVIVLPGAPTVTVTTS